MFGYRNPRQNTRRRRGTVFRTLVPRAAIALTPTRSPPQLACGHAKPIRATKKDGSITPLHPAIFISHRNRSAGVKKSPCPLFGTLMPFTDKVKGGSLFAPPPPGICEERLVATSIGRASPGVEAECVYMLLSQKLPQSLVCCNRFCQTTLDHTKAVFSLLALPKCFLTMWPRNYDGDTYI